MKELFQKLSNVFNFFKEKRLVQEGAPEGAEAAEATTEAAEGGVDASVDSAARVEKTEQEGAEAERGAEQQTDALASAGPRTRDAGPAMASIGPLRTSGAGKVELGEATRRDPTATAKKKLGSARAQEIGEMASEAAGQAEVTRVTKALKDTGDDAIMIAEDMGVDERSIGRLEDQLDRVMTAYDQNQDEPSAKRMLNRLIKRADNYIAKAQVAKGETPAPMSEREIKQLAARYEAAVSSGTEVARARGEATGEAQTIAFGPSAPAKRDEEGPTAIASAADLDE